MGAHVKQSIARRQRARGRPEARDGRHGPVEHPFPANQRIVALFHAVQVFLVHPLSDSRFPQGLVIIKFQIKFLGDSLGYVITVAAVIL